MKLPSMIDFMRVRAPAVGFSVLLVVISIGAFAWKGLNLGLDFTGGTLVELHYSEAPDLNDVRQTLSDAGYTNAVVVNFGTDRDVMVRLQTDNSDLEEAATTNFGERIATLLQEHSEAEVELLRSDVVGSQVGDELATDGALGALMAFVVVFIYVAMRFQSKFSIGALAALVHDVIVVIGVFALFQLEFDLTVLAAVMAVIGYSINDTIVVADRVRENMRIVRDMTTYEIVNLSLTQTLGRTLMTSGTTLLVVFALFLVGGELIKNFSLALIVGIGIGTYSSVYVSSAILIWMKLTPEDLLPPQKEGAELDELP